VPGAKAARHDLCVFDSTRQEADVIERRRCSNQAFGAELAEGRLEADASAESRRNADAAARVAAGRGRA